jgi:hypothetical protein
VLAVSIYEDSALIEVSSTPMEEPLDSLVVVPADKLEVVWRPVIRPGGAWKLMEATGAAIALSTDLQLKVGPAFNG